MNVSAFNESIVAIGRAKTALDDAANLGDDVPRFRGKDDALHAIQEKLATADGLLETSAYSLDGNAASAVAELQSIRNDLAPLAAAAQSRDGALALRSSSLDIRARLARLEGDVAGMRALSHWKDEKAARRDIVKVLDQGYDDMSGDDWRTLATYAEIPESMRAAMPPVAELQQAGKLVDSGSAFATKWNGWRVLNELRASAKFETREAATARYLEISEIPHDKLTRQDLHDLDAILTLPAERRPALIADDAVVDASEAAELRHQGKAIQDRWVGWAVIDRGRAASTWPTAEAASAALADMTSKGYHRLESKQWADLAAMAALPEGARPVLPPAADLNQVANGVAASAKWAGWHQLNEGRAVATWPTPELAQARLDEILGVSNDALTRRDFHDLDALATLPFDHRPSLLEEFPLTDVAEAAELRGSQSAISTGWKGWTHLDQLRERAGLGG